MSKPLILLFSVVLVLATMTTTGCATLADAQSERGEGGAGTIKTYQASFDSAWDAVKKAVEESELEVVTQNKEKGEILAQRSMTLFSYGENVAIYVNRTDKVTETQIEVISKRALAPNITAANWETRIFESLDNLLANKK